MDDPPIIVRLEPAAPTIARLEGRAATSGYRPVSVSAFASGTIAFYMRTNVEDLRRILASAVEEAALVVKTSMAEQLPAPIRERFAEANALVWVEGSPRAVFSALVRSALPRDYGLLRPSGMDGDPARLLTGAGAEIAPSATIGERAIVGQGALVGAGVRTGPDLVLGERCLVYDGVRLGARVTIGPYSLVGSRVRAYERRQDADGWEDMPQIGGLLVGDDVQIGSHCIVNVGALDDTRIGDHVRIGDRVIVGHNVRVGANVSITAGAVVCGSTIIEDGAWIGPGAVVKNKVRIGRGALVGAGCAIIEDVSDGAKVFPAPALDARALLELRRILQGARKT